MIELGKLIEGEAERDAVHVAIIPLVAVSNMSPGEHFKLLTGSQTEAIPVSEYANDAIGIVDPFLKDYVKKGKKFWGFLFPNTVTGMRHHWEHPAFGPPPKYSESELWLRQFAERWCFNFDQLIEAGVGPADVKGDRYVVACGRDCSRYDLGEDYELFWEHLEKYMGKKFSKSHREKMGWSCSC